MRVRSRSPIGLHRKAFSETGNMVILPYLWELRMPLQVQAQEQRTGAEH